jgi:diaminohydroxyphosphoribosylaminopyrimidine deaminase/5-amino-6-(5-phosphoribosylamino)uracil reductase
VLQDDPRLDVRLIDTPRQPHLVIVDSRLETPLDAKLFSTINSIATRAIYIYAAVPNDVKKQALEALGATVIYLPEKTASGTGSKVDLAAMLLDLGQREINELHVEAGFKLNGSLLKAGLVDELLVYTAPKLLGPGMGMAQLPAVVTLDGAVQLDFKSVDFLGEDLRIVARLRGHGTF